MQTNYVLIDFENVRPKNLELLARHPFKVYIFVGANQNRVPFDLAQTLQTMGNDAKYIKISGTGPDALDFHIAFYIGEIANQDSDAYFHIISRDKGFDPLVEHLRVRGFKARRSNDLAEIPVLRVESTISMDEKISTVVNNLICRGQSRPRKVKTLQNTINNLFTTKFDHEELQKIVSELNKRKYISIKDNDVSYHLKQQVCE